MAGNNIPPLILILVFLLLPLTEGCSPQTGRHVLSFFFDGVPEPDGPADSSGTVTEADGWTVEPKVAAPVEILSFDSVPVRLHYPFEERECDACHDPGSLGDMTEPEPGMCYLCHEDLSTRFAMLHGPAAGGYCTVCHHPHEAREDHLLRFDPGDLCHHCHEEREVGANAIHEDLEGMMCMDCHHPHGGEDKFNLY
ncbi:MAG: cytochrome c3 family protein [Bacteroidales bacterium]